MFFPEKSEQIVGCFLGTSMGDAWGASFVGMSADEIALATKNSSIDHFYPPVQMQIKELRNHKPGEPTDLWYFTRAVAMSLIERKKFDFANCLRLQLRQPTLGSVGTNDRTRQKVLVTNEILDLSNSIDYLSMVLIPVVEQTKRIGVGTGVAVKCIPLAVFYADQPEEYLDAVIQLTELTHRDIQVAMSAYIFGSLIGKLWKKPIGFLDAKKAQIEIYDLVDYLITEAAIFERVYGTKQQSKLHQNLVSIGRIVNSNKLGSLSVIEKRFRFSCHCHDSIALAIIMFLRRPMNFRRLLSETVSLGGDTAGNCALVGALSGINLGLKSIPIELTLDNSLFEKVEHLGRSFFDMMSHVYKK